MAAGDGPAEAGGEPGPGPGQPRGCVSEHGAQRPRRVSQIAPRRGALALVQPVAHGSPAAPGRACRPWHVRREHERVALGHDPGRRGRARPPDRLRQRREPAAVARDDEAEGAIGAAVARRHTLAARASAPDREPVAVDARRRAGHRRRLLGQTAAAGGGRRPAAVRLARAHVRVRGQRPDRAGLRDPAGVTRHGDERQRGAQGNEPQRRRLTQLGEQDPSRRPSGDLARPAGRRRALPADPHQPPPRRHRLQPTEPAALPRQPAAQPLRREEDRRAVPRHARTARQRPRRFSGRVVRSGIALGQRQQHQPSSCTAARTTPTSATATTASTASSSRRTSSTSWVSRFCRDAASATATATRRRKW